MSSGSTRMTIPAFLRRAVEVIGERREHDLIVDGIADEPVRAGADRMLAEIGARAGGNDRRQSRELNRKRGERLLQLELDV